MTLGTAIAALRRIEAEAISYAAMRERFVPMNRADLPATADLHTYHEGMRDGKLQAARIARQALDQV